MSVAAQLAKQTHGKHRNVGTARRRFSGPWHGGPSRECQRGAAALEWRPESELETNRAQQRSRRQFDDREFSTKVIHSGSDQSSDSSDE